MTNNKPEMVCACTAVATCAMVVGVKVDGSTAAVACSPVHRYSMMSRKNNV